jgi:hypothetical protein
MKSQIPSALQNPSFRFFLLKANTKCQPIEKDYKNTNNYGFFEDRLQNHIFNNGNVGIITGFGNLIVIDFDDKVYQELKYPLLPKTFTTKTAGKGLKHCYYTLEGEMIRKIGIDGKDGKRLADIQAGRECIVCPPSHIDGKSYVVIEEKPIANIDIDILSKVFDIKYFKKPSDRQYAKNENNPKAIQEAIDLFKKLGIPRAQNRHFKCPYHKSIGGQCLWIGDDGSIYCFHCSRHWSSAKWFLKEWEADNRVILV